MVGESSSPVSFPYPRLACQNKRNLRQMAKFIMSIGNEAFKLLGSEAKERDVTVQQLLRAVIVPDWIKQHLDDQTSIAQASLDLTGYRPPQKDSHPLLSPVNALRR